MAALAFALLASVPSASNISPEGSESCSVTFLPMAPTTYLAWAALPQCRFTPSSFPLTRAVDAMAIFLTSTSTNNTMPPTTNNRSRTVLDGSVAVLSPPAPVSLSSSPVITSVNNACANAYIFDSTSLRNGLTSSIKQAMTNMQISNANLHLYGSAAP